MAVTREVDFSDLFWGTDAAAGLAPEQPVRARGVMQRQSPWHISGESELHASSRSVPPAPACLTIPSSAESRTPSPPALWTRDLGPRRVRLLPDLISSAAAPGSDLTFQQKIASNMGKEAANAITPAPGLEPPRSLNIAGMMPPPLPPPGLAPPPGLSIPMHLQVLNESCQSRAQRGGMPLGAMSRHSLAASKQLTLELAREEKPAEATAAAVTIPPPVVSEDLLWLSAGSIGHPHACAGACRYVKRKGGCRDGTSCTKCHLCFWRRTEEPDAVSDAIETGGVVSISAGTRGHPHRCGAPCKYVRKKGGCRDGASCPNCHVCQWQREKRDIPAEEGQAEMLVQDETYPLVFGDSGKRLQDLIEVMLHAQALGR